MRPKRTVDEHPDGYGIAEDLFRTSDPKLARAVAKELDRIDPLPCREHDDWVEITQWGNPTPMFACGRCGERMTHTLSTEDTEPPSELTGDPEIIDETYWMTHEALGADATPRSCGTAALAAQHQDRGVPSRDSVWVDPTTEERVVIINPGWDYHEVRSLRTGRERLVHPDHFNNGRYQPVGL